jgi:O-methyltransferase
MPSNTVCERYLDLLKKSLLEELYVENELRIVYLRYCLESREQLDYATFFRVENARPEKHRESIKPREIGLNCDRTLANLGLQHAMIGRRRLENIEFCMREILNQEVPGDCIECGVWRGGATIFMRGFLAARGVTDRVVWVADSSQRLPKPSVELTSVMELFRRYSLLDDQVKFLPGWFKDTLPTAPIGQLSLLRLDGDLYESTMDTLDALYCKVSAGGFVIIDDYGVLLPCQQAVNDFRERRGITAPLEQADCSGVFWRKA